MSNEILNFKYFCFVVILPKSLRSMSKQMADLLRGLKENRIEREELSSIEPLSLFLSFGQTKTGFTEEQFFWSNMGTNSTCTICFKKIFNETQFVLCS